MKIDKQRVRSILFISLSNLGDIILTTPVFERLCQLFPDASVDVVTGQAGREVFSGHPSVRDIIVPERKRSISDRLRDLGELRRRNYDMVVDLKNTLIPYLLGAPYHSSMFSIFDRGYGGAGMGLHKKDEHLLKLDRLGLDTRGAGLMVLKGEEERRFVDDNIPISGNKKTVLVNPGAKSHLKRWPAEKYASLADRLTEELGCEIFVAGNEDDREVVGRFMDSVCSSVTDLCGKTSLKVLMEVMKRVDLVITNDSAPLHMASAVNVPTLALFGPSDETKYGPLSEKSKVIRPRVPCRPCGKALCAVGPDEGCLVMVEVDEVFNAAKEFLSG